MRIGVLSDTHDRLPMIDTAVRLFNAVGVEVVLHAGDLVSPIVAEAFSGLSCRLIAVFGNNDGDRLYLTERFAKLGIGGFFGDHHEFILGDRRLVLMHQPRSIEALAASGEFDLIVYGHTHRIDLRTVGAGKGTTILNPGEACGWLTGRATAAIVNLDSLESELIELHS